MSNNQAGKTPFILEDNLCLPTINVLELVISNQCNLACKYCFVDQQEKTMTLENLDRVIDFIKTYPLKAPGFQIFLFGGESLLQFDLVKHIITSLPDEHFVVFTNAVLLTEEKIKFFVQHKNVTFNFSLDGNRKSHDSGRIFKNGSGTFDIVVKNLRLFRKYYGISPMNPTYVKAVVSKYNIDYLLDTVKDLKNLDDFLFSFTIDREGHWTEDEVQSFLIKLDHVANYYIEHFDEIPRTDLFLLGTLTASSCKYIYCSANNNAKAQFCIGPDLKTYPCSNFISSGFSLGSLDEGIINNIDNYKQILQTRTDIITECNNCESFPSHNCWGQCPGAVQSAKGTTLTVIPEVCSLLKGYDQICKKVYQSLKYNKKYSNLLYLEKVLNENKSSSRKDEG